jgi:hypothetical protein
MMAARFIAKSRDNAQSRDSSGPSTHFDANLIKIMSTPPGDEVGTGNGNDPGCSFATQLIDRWDTRSLPLPGVDPVRVGRIWNLPLAPAWKV